MYIQNHNLAFRAKFFHTQSLHDVAEFAKETGRFERLNDARKNIDKTHLDKRLTFELFVTEDDKKIPYAIFTRYTLKDGIVIPKSIDDYKVSEPFLFAAKKKMNPLKFGYDILRKLGNSAPHNNMYKEVVSGSIKK